MRTQEIRENIRALRILSMSAYWLCLVILAAFAAVLLEATELTFELPDNAKQCFYEEVEKGQKCTLEYQVILLI